jgi:hypothetical protein
LGGLDGWGHGPFLHRGGPGIGFELFATAAEYLDLTESQIRNRLGNGQTLAEIAEEEGKSADGLVDALVDAQEADLQEAVDDGRLTESQAESIRENIEERIEFFVDRSMPPWGEPRGPHRFGSWR